MARSAATETGRTIALALDALTAVPLFLVSPLVRSWHLRWGATPEEVRGEMPGDDVVRRAQFNATRAVTIDAPPEYVWPWIVQLGCGRAGFYTYDLIDNASQPSAERILEEYQHPAVGDLMPMFKELRGLAIAYTVTAFEIDQWMVWVRRPHPTEKPDSTWTWRLTPFVWRRDSARDADEAGLRMGDAELGDLQLRPHGDGRLRHGTPDAEGHQATR
jgi:hypothetical protein